MGIKTHRANAPKKIRLGILSISTTRTLENDKSGHWIAKRAKKEGHTISFHQVVTDDLQIIRTAVENGIKEQQPQAIILTGGTGISPRDVTIEAVRPLFKKELSSFGPIFAGLSYEQIDSAAILSRATAGLIGQTLLFCIPGSLNACKLACKTLIFPEIGHLVRHLQESGQNPSHETLNTGF